MSAAQIAVLGAGAWGTTLAWLLARQGHRVRLWARRPALAEELAARRRNLAYRPEVELPEDLMISAELAVVLEGCETVVVAVPSQGVRTVLAAAAPFVAPQATIVLACKGLERGTGLRMSQVAGEVLGRTAGEGLAVLSGPNFSQEIARGLPAAAVLASQQESTAQKCQALFASAMFRVYTNCDIIGVELCGAVKNVIALAAGMSDGLGYGENAKAALITRGLAEMASLVALAGGVPHTCYGLAGVGDLVATCHSPLSRNWQMGYRVGQGQSPGAAQAAVAGVVEGVYTSAAVLALAQKRVVLPIAEAVHAVLYCGQAPAEVAAELMRRPWRAEGFDW